MGRGKKTTIQKNVGNVDVAQLGNMMEQISDPSKADPEILLPKYVESKDRIKKISKLIQILATGPIAVQCVEIANFTPLATMGEEMLTSCESDYSLNEICEHYAEFRDSLGVQHSIAICERLSPYKDHLTEVDSSFIAGIIPGVQILPRLEINCEMMMHTLNESAAKMLIEILAALYTNSMAIYKIITSPDIDISKFSGVIVDSLCEIEKHPKLSRCKRAFTKIKNSVSLLEGNFDDYYKNFVQSQNPSVIMESFIVDIAERENADPETTRQFRMIITHIRNMAKERKINDPQMEQMFNALNEKMDHVEGAMKEEDAEDESSTTEQESRHSEWAPVYKQPKHKSRKK